MVTKLEIIDTAVKVGLGALITGLFALVAVRLPRDGKTARNAKRRAPTDSPTPSWDSSTSN
jgi:hypothetical protein